MKEKETNGTMAVAFPNNEIANSFLLCVRCKKFGGFVCERCSDRYCSKKCQFFDWPLHRQICFPMPSLLEISNDASNYGHMMSMHHGRSNGNVALTYRTNFQKTLQPESRNNNGGWSYNFSHLFLRHSLTKSNRQELCDPRYVESNKSEEMRNLDLKTTDSVCESQPNLPITMKKGATRSNGADGIVNLATATKSDSTVSLTKCESQVPQMSTNWDEDIPEHIYEYERLLSTDAKDSRNWEKPFPLEQDSFVMVVHSDRSPTMNCWVIQNEHKTRTQQLLDEVKKLHCNNAELQTVTTNEVYSVRYKDNYYRGVCLYQINSKEVLVGLIDVGLTLQTKISAMKTLNRRFKALPAFALEIYFENSLDVTVGQILKIKQFSVDAVGNTNVILRPEATPIQSAQPPIKIETISIPVGVPLELFCLDNTNLDKGYISACAHDPEKIESINALSDKIKNHLKSSGIAGSYCPKLDEVCFAYHRSDRQWYRAECIAVIGDYKFEVIFADFGITCVLTSENLRKFSSEFAQPTLMHFCQIKGVSSKPTKELVRKIIKYFDSNPIFPIADAQYVDGMLIIDCPSLMRAIC